MCNYFTVAQLNVKRRKEQKHYFYKWYKQVKEKYLVGKNVQIRFNDNPYFSFREIKLFLFRKRLDISAVNIIKAIFAKYKMSQTGSAY
jgi:hypothetical protein